MSDSAEKTIKSVVIDPGCITCGACEFVAPEIFEVTDVCRVKTDADFEVYKEKIREAARLCPVSVIKVRE